MALSTPDAVDLHPRSLPAAIRLDFLDGLRGLAALYVVLYHATRGSGAASGQAGRMASAVLSWFSFGHLAVDLFIVLSGYCLMLPVARSAQGTLSGGVCGFFLRRARRILPPYYAALLLSLLLLASAPHVNRMSDVSWLPAFTPGVLLSHLFLVHNLSPAWIFKIDGPMWSVSTEWEIYFLFPLLLLAWRRVGTAITVGLALVLGLLPHSLLHRQFDTACPHFLCLFALGMAGATTAARRSSPEANRRLNAPWGMLALLLTGELLLILVGVHARVFILVTGLFAAIAFAAGRPARLHALLIVVSPAILYLISVRPPDWIGYGNAIDILVGVTTVCLLLCMKRAVTDGPQSSPKVVTGLLALLQSRGAITLGSFSYSLYLIHDPVLMVIRYQARRCVFSPPAELAFDLGVAVPLALLASYLFFLLCERPFLNAVRRVKPKVNALAAVSPPP